MRASVVSGMIPLDDATPALLKQDDVAVAGDGVAQGRVVVIQALGVRGAPLTAHQAPAMCSHVTDTPSRSRFAGWQ
jgi:hypothetical protein